jgi:hypothetical protein
VLRKGRKKGRCRLTVAPSAVLKKSRRRRIHTSSLLALGALGAAGWELSGVTGRTFYLKRPAITETKT